MRPGLRVLLSPPYTLFHPLPPRGLGSPGFKGWASRGALGRISIDYPRALFPQLHPPSGLCGPPRGWLSGSPARGGVSHVLCPQCGEDRSDWGLHTAL